MSTEAALRVEMAQQTKVCRCCGEEKPINEFYKNRIGYTNVCKDCAKIHRDETRKRKNEENDIRKQLESKRTLALSDFTPRELMAELKRRGYEYVMKYTEVHVIDSKDIEI